MKKFGILSLVLGLFIGLTIQSCEQLDGLLQNDDTAAALRQALEFSTDTTVSQAGVTNGFYLNPDIKILFPEEAQNIISVGQNNAIVGSVLNPLIESFTERINNAAEQAAPEAKSIFKETISNITISDALGILNGGDFAATNFLENNARPALYNAFKPIVENKISAVGADDIWSQVTTTYNAVPLVTPVNTDINDYVTNKALDGIFLLIAKEEQKIRQDPLHRVTELLQKVFG